MPPSAAAPTGSRDREGPPCHPPPDVVTPDVAACAGAFHTYTALGLCLRSDRPLPGLRSELPRSGEPVRLSFRPGPARPPGGDGWHLGHRSPVVDEAGEPLLDVWCRADGTRSFVYRDGHGFEVDPRATRVEIRQPPGRPVSEAVLYLFGPVFAWISRSRGWVVLHASAVTPRAPSGKEPGALLFVGEAGAGKSTAAAALVAAGARLLTDDSAVLDSGAAGDGGAGVRILPDCPRLRLWPSSAQALLGPEVALPLLTPGWEKRALDVDDRCFDPRPRPVRAIYLLEPAPSGRSPGGWRSEAVPPRRALLELLSHGSVSELLDPAMRRRELGLLTDLLATCPVRRLLRPPSARPGDLAAFLEADLGA